MRSQALTISQISWPAVIFHVVLFALAMFIAVAAFGRDVNPFLRGVVPLLVYGFAARQILSGSHRRGIRLLKRGDWDDAILLFEQSYDFFSRHSWLDRMRALVLLSPSRISYREMALVNIAFSHSQAGRGPESRRSYKRALAEFPNSILAKSALRMFDSMGRAD